MGGARQHDLLAPLARLCPSPAIYLHLWGHSEDVEQCNAWGELERLFDVLTMIDAIPMPYSSFIENTPRDAFAPGGPNP
jgi:hypothetical protein